eukprot:365733-Chlamydomonas_euryale.AAC.27
MARCQRPTCQTSFWSRATDTRSNRSCLSCIRWLLWPWFGAVIVAKWEISAQLTWNRKTSQYTSGDCSGGFGRL